MHIRECCIVTTVGVVIFVFDNIISVHALSFLELQH